MNCCLWDLWLGAGILWLNKTVSVDAVFYYYYFTVLGSYYLAARLRLFYCFEFVATFGCLWLHPDSVLVNFWRVISWFLCRFFCWVLRRGIIFTNSSPSFNLTKSRLIHLTEYRVSFNNSSTKGEVQLGTWVLKIYEQWTGILLGTFYFLIGFLLELQILFWTADEPFMQIRKFVRFQGLKWAHAFALILLGWRNLF